MPRKLVPIMAHCPYHVCTRAQNRDWFSVGLPTAWSVMEDYLYLVANAYHLRIHSFVLMSNHYHWLVTAPEGNLGEALLYFQRETSRELNRLASRINQTWGTRNHKTMIGQYHYYMNTYKYVYRNPVRARVCHRVEDYPYSTLHGLLGNTRLIIPVVDDPLLFAPDFDEERTIDWLNVPTLPEYEDEMRLALRRGQFSLRANGSSRRISALESQLI